MPQIKIGHGPSNIKSKILNEWYKGSSHLWDRSNAPHEWLEENILGAWSIIYFDRMWFVYFEKEDDFVLYQLTWG
jgi:hypothetical protein